MLTLSRPDLGYVFLSDAIYIRHLSMHWSHFAWRGARECATTPFRRLDSLWCSFLQRFSHRWMQTNGTRNWFWTDDEGNPWTVHSPPPLIDRQSAAQAATHNRCRPLLTLRYVCTSFIEHFRMTYIHRFSFRSIVGAMQWHLCTRKKQQTRSPTIPNGCACACVHGCWMHRVSVDI